MRTSVKYVLAFFLIVIALGIGLSLSSDSADARLAVWDGGDPSSALASDPDNWDTDTAPVAGDNILFDGLNATGDDPCTWDLSNNSFGTFTIAAGYSGTITQSSDMHITGYSQAGGTFTGVITKWVYCDGDFTQSDGTISGDKLSLEITNGNLTMVSGIFQGLYHLAIYGVVNATTTNPTNSLTSQSLSNYGNFSTTRIIELNWISTTGRIYINNGTITASSLNFRMRVHDISINFGELNAGLQFILEGGANGNKKVTILNNLSITTLNFYSGHTSYTCTLDLNGHNLTASSITVGTRGILQCGEGTITTSALTSTSGTITEETATWIFTNATVTATAGELFYNIHMNGWCDFTNSVNVTHDLRFINVPFAYDDIDVYLDTVYSQTIPSPYSFGAEITAGAKYEYEPDVQITMSQFYEDIDFSIYAYISTNLPVTYNITGTASAWLSYHEGRIVGMPPDIGNYTYTITATHESGSVDIVNGYILVGSLSTAEYSFDMIWELIIWIIITLFMLLGWYMEIPLIQLVAFAVGVGNIINTLRIDNFTALSLIFILGNSILFLMGMIKYSQGRR